MRDIRSIFVHCTGTEAGRDYTPGQVMAWFRARGWTNPGYHYIVHLNGKIDNLLPLSKIANGAKGYNINSVHIAYIGGLSHNIPSDTRTHEQSLALMHLVGRLLDLHHLTINNVHGHNEVSNKACPCFNVKNEIILWEQTNFNGKN